MKKILLFLLVFYFALIVLMPKVNLYYTLEDILKKELIEFEQKSISDRLFFLKIKDMKLFYDKAKVADIKDVTVFPYIFYNKILIKDLQPLDAIKNIFNYDIKEIDLTYHLFNLSKILIEANSSFGKISGSFDLKSKKLYLNLKPTKQFEGDQNLNRVFKKSKDGYIYESYIR